MPDYKIDVLLAETKAKLSQETAKALVDDRDLVRSWDGIPNTFLASLQQDVLNRRKETNPQADLKTFTGVYRILDVTVRKGRERNGELIERLRFGFLQETVYGDVEDDEWRLSGAVSETKTGDRQFRRTLPYCDPATVDSLFTSSQSVTSVTDPYAAGQKYTGKFAVTKVGIQTNDDGSVELYQSLQEIHTIADIDDLSDLTPLKLAATEILNLFGLQEGTDDLEGFTFVNLDPASQTAVTALTGAVLASTFASTGYTFASKEWKALDDNTATFAIAFKRDTWTNTTPTKVQLGRSNPGGWGESINKSATGIPITSLTAKVEAATAVSGYVLDSVSGNERGRGEAAITESHKKANDYLDDEGELTAPKRIEEIWNDEGDLIAYVYHWPAIDPSKADAHYEKAATYGVTYDDVGTPKVYDGFRLRGRSKDIGPNGLVDITSRVGSIKDKSWWIWNTTYTSVRSYIETSPIDEPPDPGLSLAPSEGFYWRWVKETVEIKHSITIGGATTHISGAMAGAGYRPLTGGTGGYVSNKVTDREYGPGLAAVKGWSDDAMTDENLALPTT